MGVEGANLKDHLLEIGKAGVVTVKRPKSREKHGKINSRFGKPNFQRKER